MEITFLGHHSWLLSTPGKNILVDPILFETFGNTKAAQFYIYPHRTIAITSLPPITAIILTNEHSGHFDIKSILSLENVPVFVSNLIPFPVKTVLEENGVIIYEGFSYEKIVIEDFNIYFCPGPKDVPLWESRVCNVIIEHSGKSILIQSDTLISPKTIDYIKTGILPSPIGLIAPNNLQLHKNTTKGPFDNLLPIKDGRNSIRVGIQHFTNLLSETLLSLNSIEHIFLSGSGYVSYHISEVPFVFSDVRELANVLNPLLNFKWIHGLLPGNSCSINNESDNYRSVNWVGLKDFSGLNSPKENNWGIIPVEDSIDTEQKLNEAILVAEGYLNDLAPLLLSSAVGKDMIAINSYLSNDLDNKRAIFRLIHPQTQPYVTQFYLDCNKCRFLKEDIITKDLIGKFPYGIELGLTDFINLNEGEIQVWDLCTIAARQWFIGSHLRSIVAFLFEYFSEQIRTDLFLKILKNSISNGK
jgi:L-ascorbate metabolism protein UlaG (beta-lactamase superfamily)